MDESKLPESVDDNPESNKDEFPTLIRDPIMLRGALKLEVSTSTPIVTAGTEFSIYVVIRNPFPAPITVYGTETHIPVALSDQNWQKIHSNEINADRRQRKELLKTTQNPYLRRFQIIGLQISWILDDIRSFVNPIDGPRVAIAVTADVQKRVLDLAGDGQITTGGGAVISGNVSVQGAFVGRDRHIHLHIAGMSEEEVRRLALDFYEFNSASRAYRLQPGDSIVVHFILKTTRWLTFTPISHTFQIQIRYEVDGIPHVDTVPFALSIRAPMASAMLGAIVGSVLGAIVSNRAVLDDPSSMIRLFLTSVIFAIIIVVAFARQNNVQQVVSIEDFWGGVFTGFLVGYAGESFIKSVIPSYPSPAAPNAP